MATVDVDGSSHLSADLRHKSADPRAGAIQRSVCIHRMSRMNSRNGYGHEDSTIHIILVRLHHSTTYVDAIYCYRPSSVVCRSVSQSVTLASPAKMAEPIEMPFGLWAWMSPRNHVLDGVQILHGNGQFWGKGAHIVKYSDIVRSPVRKQMN